MSTSSTKSVQQSSSRTAKSSSSGGGGGGGLTRETYGKLNVSAIESATQLWLAQLPAALATAIDTAPEGAFLGTLTFIKGGLVSTSSTSQNKTSERVAQKLSLQMSPQLEESLQMKKSASSSSSSVDVLPLDYTLTNITKQSTECVMHPFTRHPTNGSVELHGSVVRTLTVQMERTERYRDMCKARIYNETMMGGGGSSNSFSNPSGSNEVGGDKQQRFVQSIDTIHSLAKVDALQSSNAVKTAMSSSSGGAGGTKTSVSNGGGFGNSVAQFGKRLREAQQQQLLTSSSSTLATGTSRKRPFTFTSESSVRTILFELFSQQSHWPLKDLRAACGGFKTDKEIRTELTLIGEYQRTGQLKGLWELKAEFKDNINVAKDESATGDMGNN